MRAAVPALVVCGLIAALQQHAYAPIAKDGVRALPLDWPRIGIVLFTLLAAIGANVVDEPLFPGAARARSRRRPRGLPRDRRREPVRQPAWRLLPGRAEEQRVPARARALRVDDARRAAAAAVVAIGVRPRLRLGGVRQHPADGAGARARRLRLGRARLRRRLRRLDDLVRLVGRRRALEQLPRGEIRRRAGSRKAGTSRWRTSSASSCCSRCSAGSPSTTKRRDRQSSPHRTDEMPIRVSCAVSPSQRRSSAAYSDA